MEALVIQNNLAKSRLVTARPVSMKSRRHSSKVSHSLKDVVDPTDLDHQLIVSMVPILGLKRVYTPNTSRLVEPFFTQLIYGCA